MVEFSISDLKSELFSQHVVLEHLSNVVDIEFSLVGEDERIPHELDESWLVVVLREVVVSVSGVDLAVIRVVEY